MSAPPRKKSKRNTDGDEIAQLKAQNAQLKAQIASKDDKIAQLEAQIASRSLKTLVSMKEPLKLEEHGSGRSHTGRTKHLNAEMIVKEIQLASLDGKRFTEKIKQQVWITPSSLLLDFENESTNASEADISNFVSSALKDAVRLASEVADKKFNIRHEMSFFSQRPDHLVVVDPKTDVPLIAVEDKKPFDGKLADAKCVLGQLYDYAVVMKAFGHATPFLIMTTFQKSSMLWLKESCSNDIANDVDSSLERSFGQVENAERSLPTTGTTTKKTPSPPDLKSEVWECEGDDRQAGFQAADDPGERTLMGTEEYDSNRLVHLMYTAILCAAAANPCTETKHEIRDLKHGKWVKPYVLKMTSEDYSWGRLQAQVGSPITNEKGCYYVVGIIGAGDTSKVFHALDAAGKECVIKMYAKRTDDGGKLTLTKKDYDRKAAEATAREVERFKLLYPEIDVKTETIYKHKCVVLPFFRPIQKGERGAYLPAITEEFTRFAEQKLKYATSDVGWRHIGLHNGGRIVLFDLADLETRAEDESVEEVVAQQVNELGRRMG